jgi:hypothetical protein
MGADFRARCFENKNCALTDTLNRTATISFFGSTLGETGGDEIRSAQFLPPVGSSGVTETPFQLAIGD